MRPNKKNQSFGKKYYTVNERIRAEEVRVLNEFGEMIGVMSKSDALEKAKDVDKDLVLINEAAKPTIVKIIDLAKFKYQEQQKKAKSRKKAKAQDIKEVRFTPFMGEGDFESRLKKVKTFLEKGDKVRLSLMFKGRAITKKEFGFNSFERIFEATAEIGTVEMKPKLMGKKLIAQIMPTKSNKG
jgi:translation initiation factor IF-3